MKSGNVPSDTSVNRRRIPFGIISILSGIIPLAFLYVNSRDWIFSPHGPHGGIAVLIEFIFAFVVILLAREWLIIRKEGSSRYLLGTLMIHTIYCSFQVSSHLIHWRRWRGGFGKWDGVTLEMFASEYFLFCTAGFFSAILFIVIWRMSLRLKKSTSS